MAIDPSDYHIITYRSSEQPERWSWEIHRKSKPLGVKMTGNGYHSDAAAQFAGKRELAEFLAELSKEEKTEVEAVSSLFRSRTSYSKATPSGSFSANQASAASAFAARSPTCLLLST
jgi:hypothetical protein